MCRSVFIAGLAICVSLSNFYPQMLAAEWHATHPGASPAESKCCCGTGDGRCCGKSCCQSPARNDDPPAAPIQSNFREVPQGFVTVAENALADEIGTGSFVTASLKGLPIGASTLVEVSIRINT